MNKIYFLKKLAITASAFLAITMARPVTGIKTGLFPNSKPHAQKPRTKFNQMAGI